MNLSDIIEINSTNNDAAIVLDKGIANSSLVGNYMPTKASIRVFEHLTKAVSPSANQEQRAINIYGSYGSGKSHLAVVIAHLLKYGAASDGFDSLLSKFSSTNNERLATNLKNTFLSDVDAKPYLLVSLYGSNTTSIGAKLLEGLYDAVQREPSLEIQNILPKTEFEVCKERLEQVIQSKPQIKEQDLDECGISEYLDVESLLIGLENHESQAIQSFLKWHENEFLGLEFNIARNGGKSFVDAYKEAGRNLYKDHGYAGIVVLWDEFGHALEDMINSPYRNAGEEIIQLQQFVETACASDFGHTIFLGVTHVSFEEYGDRTKADNVVKDGLAKISGRFNTPFKIELSSSESEGYHLLGMQKAWTAKGNDIAIASNSNKDKIITSCLALPMFSALRDEIDSIISDTYPLHPSLAVALFNLAKKAAQANRTALTFFRDYAPTILSKPLHGDFIWGDELIRLPIIIDFYEDKFQSLAPKTFHAYEKAKASIVGTTTEEISRRNEILKLVLLSHFLGENFQTSEEFMCAVLFDNAVNSHDHKILLADLKWFKDANLVWKNVATGHWKLSGDSEISIEEIIEESLHKYKKLSLLDIIGSFETVQSRFFSVLGFGNFEPKSTSGIIRSYYVSAHTSVDSALRVEQPVSSLIHLLLPKTSIEAQSMVEQIRQLKSKEEYFFVPLRGVEQEKAIIDNTEKNLIELLQEYLAIDSLLKGKTLSESIKNQLIARREFLNVEIEQLVSSLFGKIGLSKNSSVIHKSGEVSDLQNISSWHDLKLSLEQSCHNIYSKDVSVRYMKMNFLFKNKELGNDHPNTPLIGKVTQRILDFSSHTSYQTELLGEKKETSQESGVINGVLGKFSNDLFIQRPELDLKAVEDLDGNIKEVLELIKRKVTLKRDKAFDLSTLEHELTSPPYGIPSCVIPILVALAVRNEMNKVRFYHKSKTDGDGLANCFMKGQSLTCRTVEFTQKQVSVLCLLGQVLRELGVEGGERKENYLPDQSFAERYTKKVKQWFSELSSSTFESKYLSKNAKLLAKTMTTIGVTNQEIAERIIEVIELKGSFQLENLDDYLACLMKLINEFAQVDNFKKASLLDCWNTNISCEEKEIENVISYLSVIKDHSNESLVGLINSHNKGNLVSADQLVNLKYDLTIEDCDDNQVNNIENYISTMFAQGKLYVGSENEVGNNSHNSFILRIKSIVDTYSNYIDLNIDKLKELNEPLSNTLIKLFIQEDITNEELDIVFQSVIQKTISEADDLEKDKVLFRLKESLFKIDKENKSNTTEALEFEVNRLLRNFHMETNQKLLVLNKIVNNLRGKE